MLVISEEEAGLLDIKIALAQQSGTKIVTLIATILVTLCCAA
jgi:hypothetical protein